MRTKKIIKINNLFKKSICYFECLNFRLFFHLFLLAISKMSTYDHTIKLKEESDKKKELKNKKKTPIEEINQQTRSNSLINVSDSSKVNENNQIYDQSYYQQNGRLSDLNYDLHIDREYYREKRHSGSNQDSKNYHSKKKLFSNSNEENSTLSCSKSEINKKYFLIQDENEKSNESFLLTQLSSNFENQMKKEKKKDRKITSNIVPLPPILPVPNTRLKN